MKLFIKTSLVFILPILLVSLSLIVVNYVIIQSTPFTIPLHKKTLIIGDSNTECAINDSIYNSVHNISSSGDSYCYTYFKLQKVLSTNHHIDTVLVSFSPRNIFDTNWMFELENSQSRMGVYYPLMSFNDYKYIHKQNIKTMCQSLPYMVKRSGINCIKKIIGKEIKYPGKHLALDRNIVLQELQKLKNREETSFIEISGKLKLAVHEVFYLKKIDSLCQKSQIALLFINTPKRPELLVFPNYGVTKFNKFYTEHFSHIPYIDLSAFPLPDQYYADLVHLNKQGAIHFSKNLKENNYIKP